MENFQPLVRLLLSKGGAVQVTDLAQLERVLPSLLQNDAVTRHMAVAAREALRTHEGSTRKTAALLLA
jgi:3-deoxy-D-manno-octulosonic-acid transferase